MVTDEGIGRATAGTAQRTAPGAPAPGSGAAATRSRRFARTSRERRITYTRTLGLIFCIAGFVVIGLGWNGMARVSCPDCQLPYLLSGGATGVGLILFGVGLLVIAQIRADQLRSELHMEELVSLLARGPAPAGSSGPLERSPEGEVLVVAGPSAYHRPGCRLLTGKTDVSSVTLRDALAGGLAPCRVCNPPEQDDAPRPSEEAAVPVASQKVAVPVASEETEVPVATEAPVRSRGRRPARRKERGAGEG
jgi:hypothetical protein